MVGRMVFPARSVEQCPGHYFAPAHIDGVICRAGHENLATGLKRIERKERLGVPQSTAQNKHQRQGAMLLGPVKPDSSAR